MTRKTESRSGDAAMGEERAQRHRRVGGDRRDDVLHRGEEGEDAVDRGGGQTRDPVQQGFDQRASSVATAITASPSPRPMNPMPSLVLAFTLIAPGASAEPRGERRGHGAEVRARAAAPR